MSKLTIFRLLVATFIFTNLAASYQMRNEGEVFIMFMNTIFSIAYIIAEVASALDRWEAKNES